MYKCAVLIYACLTLSSNGVFNYVAVLDMADAPEENAPLSDEHNLQNVLELLDDVERQVEAFRQKAQALTEERSQLEATLMTMSSLQTSKLLSETDCEDVAAQVERLARRVSSVQVTLHTVRDPAQVEAFARLSSKIDQLVDDIQGLHPETSMQNVKRYLASADADGSDRVDGCHDAEFEKLLLACTSADQKWARERLSAIKVQVCALEPIETSPDTSPESKPRNE